MNTSSTLKLISTVFFLSLFPANAHALTPAEVFDKVKDSIVVVKAMDEKGKVKGQGSGVLLPSGQVATNCHVIKAGSSYQVAQGGNVVIAALYAEDKGKDICILDAKGFTGKPVQLGAASSLKVGVPVYAVGAPRGLELSLSDGIVSQLRGGPPPLIQTTAAISKGSSGGGLFDGEGLLVGLTTLYMKDGQSLNFAMPVELLSEIKPGDKKTILAGGSVDWGKGVVALERSKNWKEMLDWCQKWTNSEPKIGLAWYKLGVAYNMLNLDNDAIEAYRQAIRINPEYATAWHNLGSSYGRLDRFDDAIAAYRQAIRFKTEYTSAWHNLGIIYGKLKRLNDAIEAFRQAVHINPEYVPSWYNLGIAYLASSDKSAAMDVVKKLRPLDPEKADKLFNMIVPR